MRKYFKNNKLLSLTALVLATTLILTGTFAWSVRLFSTTGGLGEDYHYIVKLLDIDTDPLFVIDNWENDTLDKLDKKVYATSSYNVADIKKQYNDIIAKDSNAIFRDTWVRIKLEETLMRNGSTKTDTVTELDSGKLISSFETYFSLESNDVEIITLDTWINNLETPDYDMHGRFWILDEDTGWLYWAQPLLATTELSGGDLELLDQTTSHIIDEVSLIKQPAGVWEYTIKATLEAMDVELQGYNEEGAWNDIKETDRLYELFAIDEPSEINPLPSPTATITPGSDTLSWNSVDNAVKYEIYVDGLLAGETTETSYDLVAYAVYGTTKAIGVKAIGDQTSNTDSVMSDIVELVTVNAKINEFNFPDAKFRTWIKANIAGAADNVLTEIELKAVKKIEIYGTSSSQLGGYTNLIGLNYFTEIEYIDIAYNDLSNMGNLDISNLTKLTNFYANGCSLTSITLATQIPNLKVLYLQANNLTSLIIPADLPNLINLQIRDNFLSGKLDVSMYRNLKTLTVMTNNFTEITQPPGITTSYMNPQRDGTNAPIITK